MIACKNEESGDRMFEILFTVLAIDSNKPFGWHTPADFWRECCHSVLRSQEWWKDGGIRAHKSVTFISTPDILCVLSIELNHLSQLLYVFDPTLHAKSASRSAISLKRSTRFNNAC
jgi:hypothetical protein